MTKYLKNMKDVENMLKQQVQGFYNQIDDFIREYLSDWYSQNNSIVKSTYQNDLYTSLNTSITKELRNTRDGFEIYVGCNFGSDLESLFKNIFSEVEPDYQDFYKCFCDELVTYLRNKGLKVTNN